MPSRTPPRRPHGRLSLRPGPGHRLRRGPRLRVRRRVGDSDSPMTRMDRSESLAWQRTGIPATSGLRLVHTGLGVAASTTTRSRSASESPTTRTDRPGACRLGLVSRARSTSRAAAPGRARCPGAGAARGRPGPPAAFKFMARDSEECLHRRGGYSESLRVPRGPARQLERKLNLSRLHALRRDPDPSQQIQGAVRPPGLPVASLAREGKSESPARTRIGAGLARPRPIRRRSEMASASVRASLGEGT